MRPVSNLVLKSNISNLNDSKIPLTGSGPYKQQSGTSSDILRVQLTKVIASGLVRQTLSYTYKIAQQSTYISTQSVA